MMQLTFVRGHSRAHATRLKHVKLWCYKSVTSLETKSSRLYLIADVGLIYTRCFRLVTNLISEKPDVAIFPVIYCSLKNTGILTKWVKYIWIENKIKVQTIHENCTLLYHDLFIFSCFSIDCATWFQAGFNWTQNMILTICVKRMM